ncbi:thioredoxin-like domain-containing protein [Helicobacter sp. MIT 14-3879]|uniref:TlpA family protein disulfide reductase n=1 Tax=Helicobacter sp. MIT 14-3879 TaxID=2040649 RepID=UPI000E1FACD9|nr:thioredoxin-like domain-containing protein [Helicobacter sp. MIT 14-3879]RDU65077.1 hypothetical protein CQA44_01845 [Helicobacter sp. MIT 14-3879]
MKRILLIFILLFIACNDNQTQIKKDTYSLISIESKKITFNKREEVLSTNYNKPYLLVFLSTWCDYCLGQAQHIANINEEFGDKVNIYGIFIDKDEELTKLKDFIEKSNTKFEWYYKGDIAKLVDSYKITTFPFMLLYDKFGNLVMSYDGLTPEEMISFDIKKVI